MTLIKQYSTALAKGFIEKINSLSGMEHDLTHGELKELFLSDLLENFITGQLSIGSGIIVDSKGNQSNQTDVILYDNRILPPFLKIGKLGIFPIEGVLATIEVKTDLTKDEILKSEKNSENLDQLEFHRDFLEDHKPRVLQAIIGHNNNPIIPLRDGNDAWIKDNIKHLRAICHIKHLSWLEYRGKWHYAEHNVDKCEEIKRFMAWILDNVRNKSMRRYEIMQKCNTSLMSLYMRDD